MRPERLAGLVRATREFSLNQLQHVINSEPRTIHPLIKSIASTADSGLVIPTTASAEVQCLGVLPTVRRFNFRPERRIPSLNSSSRDLESAALYRRGTENDDQ